MTSLELQHKLKFSIVVYVYYQLDNTNIYSSRKSKNSTETKKKKKLLNCIHKKVTWDLSKNVENS